MSSPLLATTTRSAGSTTSSTPRASLAPPVPPASTTTGALGREEAALGTGGQCMVARGEARRLGLAARSGLAVGDPDSKGMVLVRQARVITVTLAALAVLWLVGVASAAASAAPEQPLVVA